MHVGQLQHPLKYFVLRWLRMQWITSYTKLGWEYEISWTGAIADLLTVITDYPRLTKTVSLIRFWVEISP